MGKAAPYDQAAELRAAAREANGLLGDLRRENREARELIARDVSALVKAELGRQFDETKDETAKATAWSLHKITDSFKELQATLLGIDPKVKNPFEALMRKAIDALRPEFGLLIDTIGVASNIGKSLERMEFLGAIPADDTVNREYARQHGVYQASWPKPYKNSVPVRCAICGGAAWLGPMQQTRHQEAEEAGTPLTIVCLFDAALVSEDPNDPGFITSLTNKKKGE